MTDSSTKYRLLRFLTINKKRYTSKEICEEAARVKISITPSEVRKIANELRRERYPIASSSVKPYGYWIGDEKDVERTIAHMLSRVQEQMGAVRGLKEWLHAQVNKETLFDDPVLKAIETELDGELIK